MSAANLSERLIRAYLEGAESGMVEVRGYGLTAAERAEAELTALALYGVVAAEPEVAA